MCCHDNPIPLSSNPMVKPSHQWDWEEVFCLLFVGRAVHVLKCIFSFSWSITAAPSPSILRTKRNVLSVHVGQGAVSGWVTCNILTEHPSSGHSKPLRRSSWRLMTRKEIGFVLGTLSALLIDINVGHSIEVNLLIHMWYVDIPIHVPPNPEINAS